jgi:hypothetical protein
LGRFNFNAYWDKGNNQRQIDIWPAGKQKGDSVPLLRIEAKTGNIIEKFDWVHDGTADYAF